VDQLNEDKDANDDNNDDKEEELICCHNLGGVVDNLNTLV